MGWLVGPVCSPRLRWRGASWLQLAGVWPGLASRGCAGGYIFLPYLYGVATGSGFGAGSAGAIGKTAAAEQILPDLVRLYC